LVETGLHQQHWFSKRSRALRQKNRQPLNKRKPSFFRNRRPLHFAHRGNPKEIENFRCGEETNKVDSTLRRLCLNRPPSHWSIGSGSFEEISARKWLQRDRQATLLPFARPQKEMLPRHQSRSFLRKSRPTGIRRVFRLLFPTGTGERAGLPKKKQARGVEHAKIENLGPTHWTLAAKSRKEKTGIAVETIIALRQSDCLNDGRTRCQWTSGKTCHLIIRQKLEASPRCRGRLSETLTHQKHRITSIKWIPQFKKTALGRKECGSRLISPKEIKGTVAIKKSTLERTGTFVQIRSGERKTSGPAGSLGKRIRAKQEENFLIKQETVWVGSPNTSLGWKSQEIRRVIGS